MCVVTLQHHPVHLRQGGRIVNAQVVAKGQKHAQVFAWTPAPKTLTQLCHKHFEAIDGLRVQALVDFDVQMQTRQAIGLYQLE